MISSTNNCFCFSVPHQSESAVLRLALWVIALVGACILLGLGVYYQRKIASALPLKIVGAILVITILGVGIGRVSYSTRSFPGMDKQNNQIDNTQQPLIELFDNRDEVAWKSDSIQIEGRGSLNLLWVEGDLDPRCAPLNDPASPLALPALHMIVSFQQKPRLARGIYINDWLSKHCLFLPQNSHGNTLWFLSPDKTDLSLSWYQDGLHLDAQIGLPWWNPFFKNPQQSSIQRAYLGRDELGYYVFSGPAKDLNNHCRYYLELSKDRLVVDVQEDREVRLAISSIMSTLRISAIQGERNRFLLLDVVATRDVSSNQVVSL